VRKPPEARFARFDRFARKLGTSKIKRSASSHYLQSNKAANRAKREKHALGDLRFYKPVLYRFQKSTSV